MSVQELLDILNKIEDKTIQVAIYNGEMDCNDRIDEIQFQKNSCYYYGYENKLDLLVIK